MTHALKPYLASHMLGQYIGRYRLIDILGRGGFATIYLGMHRYLGTLAAIKILKAQLTREQIEKFRGEACIAASLIHPHIVRVLDFGVERHIPFLVMDYAPNGTLRQRHPRGQPLPMDTVLAYLEQIGAALEYMHQHHVVHQDIKPANMLLGCKGELLLSDFGIAVSIYGSIAPLKERIGTLPYMAPEQIRGTICYASDQYALGIVVYEWLCGTLPFSGSSATIQYQHLYHTPPSLHTWVPAISSGVEQVVLRAIAKEPEQRFGSVQDFMEALKLAALLSSPAPVTASIPVSRPYSLYLHYQPVKSASRRLKQPMHRETVQPQPEPQPQPRERRKSIQAISKEIVRLFLADILIGSVVMIILYALGIQPQTVWFLLALCVVSLPLCGAAALKNMQAFILASSIFCVATAIGLVFHSLLLFAVLYVALMLLSLLIAFTLYLHRF